MRQSCRYLLPVAALQLHKPRAPVTDHPLSLHGHACAGDGSSPSQTEAPIDATRVAMKPVLYSSAHEHACAGDCRDRLMHRVVLRSLQWHAPDSTQTEPELWSVLPVAALHSTYLDQPHLPIHRHLHTPTLGRPRSHVTRAPGVMLVVYRIP